MRTIMRKLTIVCLLVKVSGTRGCCSLEDFGTQSVDDEVGAKIFVFKHAVNHERFWATARP